MGARINENRVLPPPTCEEINANISAGKKEFRNFLFSVPAASSWMSVLWDAELQEPRLFGLAGLPIRRIDVKRGGHRQEKKDAQKCHRG